jgi:16S rRNA (cytosine967-C5)-methyltransferase
MTPSARVQAAIELLDLIIEAARNEGPAADSLISAYFKARRYAGSGDRRAVRELVYRAIRRSGEPPASGRSTMLGLADEDETLTPLFDGGPHGPARASPEEERAPRSFAPAWLAGKIDEIELPALLERAPLDLRVNRLKGTREEALLLLPEASPTPHSPLGLRLPDGFRIEDHEAWRSGLVELQDEGSQLLSLACRPQPGMIVVDLCAGAGGKTLALAAEMGDRGRIVAADTDRGRLSRMRPRLERAGAKIVEPLLLDPGREAKTLADLAGAADLILVDAPCSGTGTWRRNPETRWRLTPERLERLVALQVRLLDIAATLVRPGGTLVYGVCSMLAGEGPRQADALSARSSMVPETVPIEAGRAAGGGRLLSPAHDGTDGFFVARWRAPC